jgi:GAF domain-containing protein
VRPDPLELDDDDVLARVTDLLDRKLFEASVTGDVAAIATDVRGFEETVAAVLETLGRVVDCDLVGVALVEESTTYVSVQSAASLEHHDAFLAAVGQAADQTVGTVVSDDLHALLADPQGLLGTAEVEDGEDAMATFLSMPLRAVGRTLGLLAMSSAAPNAFGESALTTLRLVAGPAAVVISHARLAAVPVG